MTTQPSELARKIAEELAHDPITVELSEERFCAHVASLIDQHIAELLRDRERLNRLCDECYLPDDHPKSGLFMCAGEDIIPLGGIKLAQDTDRKAIREAIDASMAKEAK